MEFLATWGVKLLLPFISALSVYYIDKYAPVVYGRIPSELLPTLAGAVGVLADQALAAMGARCPTDMPTAACVALSALLGLAGTGLDQVRKQLAAYKRDGGTYSQAHIS